MKEPARGDAQLNGTGKVDANAYVLKGDRRGAPVKPRTYWSELLRIFYVLVRLGKLEPRLAKQRKLVREQFNWARERKRLPVVRVSDRTIDQAIGPAFYEELEKQERGKDKDSL